MTGCVSARLDDYASTPDRIATLLSLSDAALASLRLRGCMPSRAFPGQQKPRPGRSYGDA